MGTLKMARKLTAKEFYSLISLVRLGISMGSFDENTKQFQDFFTMWEQPR